MLSLLVLPAILGAEWKFDLKNGNIQSFNYYDGGSRGIALIDEKKNQCVIFLDRSYPEIEEDEHGFPLIKPMVPREDGLVYLGSENFSDRRPVEPKSEEYKQLVSLFDKRIAIERARGQGYVAILAEFRNGLDRNRSNK